MNQSNSNYYFTYWSSLIQDECQTWATRVRQERHQCDTIGTRLRHEWDTSKTSAIQVRHECYTNGMSSTQVKKFDFDSDTSKNICLHPFVYYMASERIQGEEQLHSMNCLLEMLCSHAKMRLKSAPQKLDFLMTKAISKSCTLDCSCKCLCTFPHSYTQ